MSFNTVVRYDYCFELSRLKILRIIVLVQRFCAISSTFSLGSERKKKKKKKKKEKEKKKENISYLHNIIKLTRLSLVSCKTHMPIVQTLIKRRII